MRWLTCALVLTACGSTAQPVQRTQAAASEDAPVIELRRGARRHVVDVCGENGPVDHVYLCVAPVPAPSRLEGRRGASTGGHAELDGAEVSVHFGCEAFGGATWLLSLESSPFAPGCAGIHQAPLQVAVAPSPLVLGVDGLVDLLRQIQHSRSFEPLTIAVPAFPPDRVPDAALARLRAVRQTLEGVQPVALDAVERGHRIDALDESFSIEVVDVTEVDGTPNLVLRARVGTTTLLLPGRLTRSSAQALVRRVCEGTGGPCPALQAHLLHVVQSCEPVADELFEAVDPGVVIVHRTQRPCDAAAQTIARARSRGALTLATDPVGPGSYPRIAITPALSGHPSADLRRDDDESVRWSARGQDTPPGAGAPRAD